MRPSETGVEIPRDADRPEAAGPTASGSSQTRPPYWLPAGLVIVFFAPGALLAAFWPRLTGFELISRYGDAYAFWMYLAACQFTAGAQAACILIWEALVRLRAR